VKSVPRDALWRRLPPAAGCYRPWLRDRGSLTGRLQQRCPAFSMKVMFQGLRRINRDERFLFGRRTRGLALVREVYLYCRGAPVVFAHSVVRVRDLRGGLRWLNRLGGRPLGAALFADPRIGRYPLRQKKLGRRHELYRRACGALSAPPATLWARRSLFILHKSPILVTEVFLPEILKLG
jgi:chorismate--pyruvate lyase